MTQKNLCALLIHGFGGGAYEVEPLAKLLEAQGIPCHIARLAGHEDGKQSIDNLPYTDWVDSARACYDALSRTNRVACIGFSMGGLIAAALHEERPFDALVLINTPIYFWNLPQVMKNLKADPTHALSRYFVECAGRTPPYALLQFLRLLAHARGFFAAIECPALIVQADNDDTVWPRSATFLCGQIKGKTALYRAAHGGHAVLLCSEQCARIAQMAVAFLRKL